MPLEEHAQPCFDRASRLWPGMAYSESRGLETLLSQIADEHGFRPDNAVVEINGLCGTCAVDEQG